MWQEDESSNRLREESLTLITEDSRDEGRVRERDSGKQSQLRMKKIFHCLIWWVARFPSDRKKGVENPFFPNPREKLDTPCVCSSSWFITVFVVLLTREHIYCLHTDPNQKELFASYSGPLSLWWWAWPFSVIHQSVHPWVQSFSQHWVGRAF